MAKMAKKDIIRVTITRESNSDLLYNIRTMVEIQNQDIGKVSTTTSWYATLGQAVEHTSSQLRHLDLYRATGIIPTLPGKCR